MRTFNSAMVVAAFICLSCWPIKAAAQNNGSITGRVVSESGKPLVNISVALSSPGNSSRSTTTDAEGNFQFNGLTDRPYFVSALPAQGYIPKPMPIEDRSRRYRPGDSVTFSMVKGGVITGRVSDADGNPVINIPISLIRVRDSEGNKQNFQLPGPYRSTDDLGIYRLYGLQPGTYIVAANSNGTIGMGMQQQYSPYYGQTPTYHPSATRDTAKEVQLNLGDEASGIDIRFRGEIGRIISGKVTGGEALMTNSVASVSLTHAATEAQIGTDLARSNGNQLVFSIPGIPDGEYFLMANRGSFETDEFFRSEPRRITVKGADVTGVNLTITPMAVVAGHVVLEKSPTICDAKLTPTLQDVSLTIRRSEPANNQSTLLSRFALRGGSADAKGEFKIRDLAAGLHRLTVGSRNENWFVKSIYSTPAGDAKSAIVADLTRSGVRLNPGEKLTTVTVTVGDGAASVSGKLAVAREGEKLPSLVRVHLIPAEPTAAENLLRYAEAPTSNGAFHFTNLAPGKYWLLTKPMSETEKAFPQPAAWDSAERLKLRKEAEAAKNEIELKACQRVKDFVLKF